MKRKSWIRIGRISLLVYLGCMLVLVMLETYLVYPAPPRGAGNWSAEAAGCEDVWFSSAEGNRVHGWLVAHEEPQSVILFCHGNGEHVALLGPELHYLSERLKASVLAFDYRGYGQSEGKPHEDGVLADARAAHQWLAERCDVKPEEIVLYGRSLGGAVAVHLAATQGARALVIERTFHSMVDIGADLYWWLPVRWLMRNRYAAEEWMEGYEGPIRQLHGTEDRIVPLESARALFAASSSPNKELHVEEGMGHNDPTPSAFLDAVERLLRAP